MATKNIFNDFEGMFGGLSKFEKILRNSNLENFGRLSDSMARAIEPSIAVAEIVGRQTKLLSSLDIPSYSQTLAVSAMEKQWSSLARIVGAYRTPEIIKLQESLLKNEFAAMQAFSDSLKTPRIEAPNIALIKIAPIFDEVSFPKGIMTAVNGIHVDAAKRLINSESVSFDTEDRMFYVESSPEDRATISETNILCSSLHLLSGIDEADLISFLQQLEKFPAFAIEHETGKRICGIVSCWDQYLDFDHEYFYHARPLSEGACPYTESDLRKAPTGYTGHGRYNYIGQSHYYFSDKERGAILEVTKHTNEKRIQIAKLHPKKPIRMIDLSGEVTAKNKFLEYCRFNPAPTQYPYVKREYLLPCFVANCCEKYGIDGIKYYGSKEYKNYVSWYDGYFDIISSRITENGKGEF